MNPLVSIVIPVYNGEDYCENAICSVLNQTYDRIELIVLDDGSTDRTPEIIAKYSQRIVAHRHSNMGQAGTLNRGWTLARGEILSYLSADDLLLPQAVEAAVREFMRSDSLMLAYCDYNLIDAGSRHIRRVHTPDYSYDDLAVKLVCQPGPGVFFRRRAFDAIGGWSGELRQMPDFDYWLKLGLFGDFRRIPEVHAHYRVHELSQTFSKASEARADEPVRIMSAYFAEQLGIPERIRRRKTEAMSNAYLLSARLHMRSDRMRQGLSMAGRAFRLHPANLFAYRTFRLLSNALLHRPAHMLLHWFRRSLDSVIKR